MHVTPIWKHIDFTIAGVEGMAEESISISLSANCAIAWTPGCRNVIHPPDCASNCGTFSMCELIVDIQTISGHYWVYIRGSATASQSVLSEIVEAMQFHSLVYHIGSNDLLMSGTLESLL